MTPDEKADDDKIARCLRSEEGKVLLRRLDEWLRRDFNGLKGAMEPIIIGRYQGKIEIIERLFKLKED